MPVVIPPGATQIGVLHHGPSTVGSVPTWTFAVTGTVDETAVGEMLLWFQDNYAPELSELYSMIGLRLSESTGSITATTEIEGSRTGAVMPPQVAALVQKNTSSLGRHGRGRLYLPGHVNQADVADDGRMSDARVLALSTEMASFNSMLSANTLVPVILHSDSSDPTVINSFGVERLIATQRRRLRT